MDEYGIEWWVSSLQPDESLARGSHGIQPHSEEKEIVCWEWFPDTVEGRSPDTILLLQPNGMVEIVGSIPSCISHTNKQMIMKYIIEFLSFAVLTLLCLYSFTILMVMIWKKSGMGGCENANTINVLLIEWRRSTRSVSMKSKRTNTWQGKTMRIQSLRIWMSLR